MRTTISLDDDLLSDLKTRAAAQGVPLTKFLNQLLRQAMSTKVVKRARYKEKVFSLGPPRISLDKSLALAALEEDEEVLRKLAARK